MSNYDVDRRAVLAGLGGGLALSLRAEAKAAKTAVSAPGPLWRCSATELSHLIRTRQVTCSEVAQAHLARIRAVNPALNAIGVVMEEQALRAAAEADAAVVQGKVPGPLFGVPLTVKENIDVAGSATSQGVKAWRNNIAGEDAPAVVRLKRAGAIICGRTNMPDLAVRFHTDSSLHGATINPWDKSLTPGGSSGGDAVAVASGMVPIGLGNDFGGSLRFPAQCAGVAALRPSRGRVAHAEAHGKGRSPMSEQLFAVDGPIARRVEDLRAALALIAGPDARDPWWVPAPMTGAGPGSPIKVAVIADPVRQGVDPGVAEGIKKASKALGAAGYVMEEVDFAEIAHAADLWAQIVTTEIRLSGISFLSRTLPPASLSFIEHALEVVPPLDAAGYMGALASRNACCRAWSEWFQRYSLILGPVSTAQPFAVGWDISGKDAAARLLSSLRLVLAGNLVGAPAVVVPIGLHKGLPQSVQILGPMFREDLCLDAAETIERSLGTLTPVNPS